MALTVEYYKFKDSNRIRGAGTNPALLQQVTPDWVEFLPGCTLDIHTERTSAMSYCFQSDRDAPRPCCFTEGGQQYQVSLGFAVTATELLIYDRGIDPKTGKAIWGA